MARNRPSRPSNNLQPSSSKGRHTALPSDQMDTSGYFSHNTHLPAISMDSLTSTGSIAVANGNTNNSGAPNSMIDPRSLNYGNHHHASHGGQGPPNSGNSSNNTGGPVNMNPSGHHLGNNPGAIIVGGNSSNNNSSNNAGAAAVAAAATAAAALSYENTDLDSITLRQLKEDIDAYRHDMAFCTGQLSGGPALGLTPQEIRTLQLRVLDLGHQIRTCEHRVEILQFQAVRGSGRRGGSGSRHHGSSGVAGTGGGAGIPSSSSSFTVPSGTIRPRGSGGFTDGSSNYGAGGKHPSGDSYATSSPGGNKRAKTEGGGRASSAFHSDPGSDDEGLPPRRTDEVTRLGTWKCRLCRSQKFLLAGSARQPAMPCKWPLKDTAKTIAHYAELHTEHDPEERCMELGDALDYNRGPFEYWLRRTRSVDVGDGGLIDRIIGTLQAGGFPEELRLYSRAASNFPRK